MKIKPLEPYSTLTISDMIEIFFEFLDWLAEEVDIKGNCYTCRFFDKKNMQCAKKDPIIPKNIDEEIDIVALRKECWTPGDKEAVVKDAKKNALNFVCDALDLEMQEGFAFLAEWFLMKTTTIDENWNDIKEKAKRLAKKYTKLKGI